MKKSINLNIAWSQYFVHLLYEFGISHVVISPGSRSTPLTISFSKYKKIKKHIIIDERSNGFYALGLAKQVNSPVAIVSTSGTAVAELYPSIIEAFYSRIPLIICTADRPEYLRTTGANQTINQKNIYSNHIRNFFDLSVTSVDPNEFQKLKSNLCLGIKTALFENPGPVHFNIQFDKPFEPSVHNTAIDNKSYQKIFNEKIHFFTLYTSKTSSKEILTIKNKIKRARNFLVIVGPAILTETEKKYISQIATSLNAPIFADALSSMRSELYSNLIKNYDTLFRSKIFTVYFNTDFIFHFGGTPTSNNLLNFIKDTKAFILHVDMYKDSHDACGCTDLIIQSDIANFYEVLYRDIPKNLNSGNHQLAELTFLDRTIEKIKQRMINRAQFPFEGRIITEILKHVPDNSNVMISNSLPVRDFDFFNTKHNKKTRLFYNRGASGIDGIISTANGIAIESKNPTILITGDLAFYHDMNGLLTTRNFNIPMVIILINNNGGAIFEMLPVAKEKINLSKYFKTPHNLDFSKFVRGYEGFYSKINSWKDLENKFRDSLNRNTFSVLEINSNSKESIKIRRKYWDASIKTIDKLIA